MVKIPEKPLGTVEAIYKYYENKQKYDYRDHLGASVVGDNCDRRIWYIFRWAYLKKFTGRILRLFETGNLAEARFTSDLRGIGVQVWDVDPDTGQQWQVRDEFGHLGGSMDGIGLGIIEAPKTEHVLEFKTHNDKSYKDLLKNGVFISKPMHFAQMQIYMHLKKLNRALYLAVNKNTDELYSERVGRDVEFGIKFVSKGNRIINSVNPPDRISENPAWHECKMCDFNDVCHGRAVPPRHCRSCLFATPVAGGKWHCGKHDRHLSPQEQRSGCREWHRYIPAILTAGGAEQIDGAADGSWITYRTPEGGVWRDDGTR